MHLNQILYCDWLAVTSLSCRLALEIVHCDATEKMFSLCSEMNLLFSTALNKFVRIWLYISFFLLSFFPSDYRFLQRLGPKNAKISSLLDPWFGK